MKKILTVALLLIAGAVNAQVISIVYGDANYMEKRSSSSTDRVASDEYMMKATAPDGIYNIFSDAAKTKVCQKGLMGHGHPMKFWNFYYENQNMKSSYMYDSNGMKAGNANEYYETGVLKSRTTYFNDVANGPATFFGEDGKRLYDCVYKNGVLNDRKTTYDANGNVVRVEEYQNGQLRK